MAHPIHLQKTLFLPLLISLLTSSPLALSAENKSDWDCHQDEVSGEWSCVTEKAKQAPHSEKLPVIVEKTTASTTPAIKVTKPEQAEKQKQFKPTAIAEVAKEPAPGWACKLDKEKSGWDCTLSGPDPQGKLHPPRPLDYAQNGSEPLAPSDNDALMFQNMLDVIPQDPWGNCSSELGGPTISRHEATSTIRQQSPAYIESDFSEALENDEVVTFTGNVDFKRADQTLRADRLTHDQFANSISAQGNVLYHEEGVTFQSEKSFMWLNSDKGKLHNSKFIFETIPARGGSQLTTLESKTLSHHRDITYTTCRPGNQDWELEANELTLDQENGVGIAENVWVSFKDIPLFYSPWLTFPLDDRRKSGFLMPSIGSGDKTGFDLSTPYYWNIAPNYDATITPRYLSRRGLLLGAELRYLSERSEGEVAAEIIANDRQTDDTRGQITLENKTRFSDRLSSKIDINLVSDDDYLDDYGNSLSINDTSHLLNRADLNYQGSGWSLLGRVDGYQTIDHNIDHDDLPYRRLPQILFNMDEHSGPAESKLNLQTEFIYFDRGDRVTGKRLNIQPEISFPMRTAATFLTPTLALQATQYWLDDPTKGTDNITRTLPILSVDSGLFFERDLKFSEQSWQQTLEPRLFYLYVPHEDQDDIPIFDTGEYDFSFSQLFRDNRFNGLDRTADANQLTAALTTRFIESETGRERLGASIGQIFYFKDREVTLPGEPILTNSSSDMIAEIDAILTDHWTFRTDYQWDPHEGASKKASASLRYRDSIDRLFNLAYQFREDTLDQTDVSVRWPITETWHGVARWNYSLRDQITLDSFLGVEKESCCWRFKFLVRNSVDDANSDPETTFFFQLELKGLSSFGDKLGQKLSDEIPGYRLPENR